MNLYKVYAPAKRDYDEYAGFVVVADDPAKARGIAGATATAERRGSPYWDDSEWLKQEVDTELAYWNETALVVYLGPSALVSPCVVLSDYRAG